MPLIFLTVDEEVAVQLLNMVLGERDMVGGGEDQFHDFSVAGHLLFVPRGERLDRKASEQFGDFPI